MAWAYATTGRLVSVEMNLTECEVGVISPSGERIHATCTREEAIQLAPRIGQQVTLEVRQVVEIAAIPPAPCASCDAPSSPDPGCEDCGASEVRAC